MNEPTNPYAVPQAFVQDPTTSNQNFVLASLGRRFCSSLVDGLIVVMFCAVAFGVAYMVAPGEFDEEESYVVILGLAMGIGVPALINAVLLVTKGQTMAKTMFNIRIVRPDGSSVSAGRLLGLRYVVPGVINMIPLVGNIFALVNPLMIFRASRRCLHDDMADTIVIKA